MVIEEILHAILNLQDMVPEILPTTPRGVNRLGGTMLEIFNHPLEDSTLENASRDPDVLSIQITFTPNPEEEQEQKVVTKKPSQRWANQVEKFVHMVGTMGVFARKASTFLLGFLILYLTIRITTFAVVLIFRIAVWLFSPFAYLLALRAQVPTTPSDSSNTTTITIAAAAPRIQARVEGPVQFMEVACPGPKTRIHDWEVVSFTLTSDQRVVPIEYTLDLANAHQVSMLDVDKQDTKMRVVVDGVVRGLTRDFDLNPDVDCGDGLGPGGFRNCMTMGHSVGQLTITSGLHKVNIQYAGKGMYVSIRDLNFLA
ncbi:hypothetical protein BDN72DRAFT_170317 [Pluteus cervinus]|uniref:Uncharacterized protein n=1 Tax=Pluteus cervinus TaxID=181527 RepID=A0ACD3AL92_9AGAR|nr:hypothetical protein BDN72DRAFT_170317 [Pluteus cervinus]